MTYGRRRRRVRPTLWVLAVVVLVAGVVYWAPRLVDASGGGPVGGGIDPTSPVVGTGSSAGTTSPSDILIRLDAIPIVSGSSDAPYDRDLFGDPWTDVDRNGCDTRNDILGRDLLEPVYKPGTNDCKVLAGRLIDPYTGESIVFASGPDTSPDVQIDHVVSLSWAWRHGAEHWDAERLVGFANDPTNLVASGADSNQSKSWFGPGDWLPDDPVLRCAFVEEWVGVVADYGLGISATDAAASRAVLAGCAG